MAKRGRPMKQPTDENGNRIFAETLTDQEILDYREEQKKDKKRYMRSRGYR